MYGGGSGERPCLAWGASPSQHLHMFTSPEASGNRYSTFVYLHVQLSNTFNVFNQNVKLTSVHLYYPQLQRRCHPTKELSL